MKGKKIVNNKFKPVDIVLTIESAKEFTEIYQLIISSSLSSCPCERDNEEAYETLMDGLRQCFNV